MAWSCLARPTGRQKFRSLGLRWFNDFIRGPTPNGTYKVPLKSQKVVGVYQSRGSRLYQEDAIAVHGLQLPTSELKSTLEKYRTTWDPSKAGSEFLAGQIAYFGIFDGHGGKDVSAYVSTHLHQNLENVKTDDLDKAIEFTLSHGGYFKRWRGGMLQRWTQWSHDGKLPETGSELTLEERISLAFLKTDQEVISGIEKAQNCGSTGTVALLHSLDEPGEPYWAAKKLHLTIGHCGDTRALLCHRADGEAIPLTEKHHAETRIESARLRRMGADRLVADSFGESRWMGAIENTRGFGDGEWKASGVTAEPEVVTKVLNGEDYCYLVMVTDGLTSQMSDQEIIDLARNSVDPTRAAKTIVHLGEDLGAEDNCSCVVVPLAGWGKVGGTDRTEERREYRKRQAGALSTRMQRM